MASALQNRIVGTVIVIALAVIILPDLLAGKNYQFDNDIQVSPLRPDLNTVPERAEFPDDFDALTERQLLTYDGEVTDAEPQEARLEATAQNRVETPRTIEPVIEENTGSAAEEVSGDAWAIQLGAFRNADRVAELVATLRAEGHPAYSRLVRNSQGQSLTLLLVGPDIDRSRLEQKIPELKQIVSLDGRIVEYQPAQ
ncbi:MAG: SPOR domain-containing protein [Aliidiomarina sp.]|uniref:SPOR domain-containing protein n=1 Tax=Aliidiomarina sp. TaxID=1872439 RepID=UPI0025BFD90D|nr:SPOR domain-containing protein [Aliidiomarina sp.]MCH8501419.1 SPOR domain-containing protein [Aliidiomarina sp.]